MPYSKMRLVVLLMNATQVFTDIPCCMFEMPLVGIPDVLGRIMSLPASRNQAVWSQNCLPAIPVAHKWGSPSSSCSSGSGPRRTTEPSGPGSRHVGHRGGQRRSHGAAPALVSDDPQSATTPQPPGVGCCGIGGRLDVVEGGDQPRVTWRARGSPGGGSAWWRSAGGSP